MRGEENYIFCPFFKKTESINVRCEGPTRETRLILQFTEKKKREEYQNEFCKSKKCEECRIYKMLDKKY